MNTSIFDEYKKKIIHALDYQDANSLVDIATSVMGGSETEIKILNSLLDKNRYNNKMNFDRFLTYINIVSKIEYKNDAEILIEDLESIIDDNVQLNTLRRLILKKPRSDNNKNYKNNKNNKNHKYVKQCPHCTKNHTGTNDTTYVVCGYTEKGYDWKGCGKDWCFKCNKKLCKSWNTDHLYNKLNRIHDARCCKSYSNNTKDKYPDNYCQCTVEYIRTR